MGRTYYIPEAEKPEPRFGKGEPEVPEADNASTGPVEEPELSSFEEFLCYLAEDEREDFTHVELAKLARNTKTPAAEVREHLEAYGYKLRPRERERPFRGASHNPHDRWYGPGSCRGSGGGTGDSIMGFAGRAG